MRAGSLGVATMRAASVRGGASARATCATGTSPAARDDAHASRRRSPLSPLDRRRPRAPGASARDGASPRRSAARRSSCYAERALYWPRGATLFVADVHLGKARGVSRRRRPAAARRDGDRSRAARARCSPRTRRDAARRARRFPARGRRPRRRRSTPRSAHGATRTRRSRSRWCAATTTRTPATRRRPGASTSSPSRTRCAPFLLCHEPARPRTGYALCGHVHPGVRLARRGGRVGAPALLRARPAARAPAGVRPPDRPRADRAGAGETVSRSPARGCSRCPATSRPIAARRPAERRVGNARGRRLARLAMRIARLRHADAPFVRRSAHIAVAKLQRRCNVRRRRCGQPGE